MYSLEFYLRNIKYAKFIKKMHKVLQHVASYTMHYNSDYNASNCGPPNSTFYLFYQKPLISAEFRGWPRGTSPSDQ